MKNLDQIKRSITCATDRDALREISKACRKRLEVLRKREHVASIEAAETAAANLIPGTVVYCHRTSMGGADIFRGDRAEVIHWQPRVKRLWVRLANGRQHWFEGGALVTYNWRLDLPEDPASPESVERQKAMNRILRETLT